jgi:hypothetical protein
MTSVDMALRAWIVEVFFVEAARSFYKKDLSSHERVAV